MAYVYPRPSRQVGVFLFDVFTYLWGIKFNQKMNQTHVFTLTSGVECEVTYFTGHHQDMLTRQDSTPYEKRLDALLVSIIVRIGSETQITDKFVASLLSGDRKKILVEARQFSLGFQPYFEFPFEYKDSENRKQTEEVRIELEEGGKFPEKPLCSFSQGENGELIFTPVSYSEYSEIERTYRTTMPMSGREVQLTLLDGDGEQIAARTKAKERSSSMLISMRRPVWFRDGTPIKLELGNLHLRDIEHLRTVIRNVEGDVDTKVTFEHPEAEKVSAQERMITQDVLNSLSFFFPSGAI